MNNTAKEPSIKRKKLISIKWMFIVASPFASAILVPLLYSLDRADASSALATLLILAGCAVCLTAWILILADLSRGGKKTVAIIGNILVFFMLPVVCLLAFAAGGEGSAQPRESESVSTSTSHKIEIFQDKRLLSLLRSVGAKGDYSALTITFAKQSSMKKVCGWTEAGGCYDGKDTITVNASSDPSYRKVIIAHEYLHYAWDKHDLSKESKLTSALIDLYARAPSMQQRVDRHYLDTGGLQPTEFFAYGCTEMSDVQLGAYITAWCNKYINTSKLPIAL